MGQVATTPPLADLANLLVGAMLRLEPGDQQLALALYRWLARGEPVTPTALADALGRDDSDVTDTLGRWPGVFRTDDGRIDSFWGLAIPEMSHRLRIDGRELYTWCAWDALFIPQLIGRTAEVESRSPVDGELVRLVVDPERVREVAPESAVVSMLSPAEAFDYRVIMRFCNFVHFFPSSVAGTRWVAEHPGTFLLSVPEAHELGRIVNGERLGAGLVASRGASRDSS